MNTRAEHGQPDAAHPVGGAQRARRRRILETARRLASSGGYEAVQMRNVADEADVALGTLYRYFPSKVHLLVSVLEEELQRAHDLLAAHPVTGGGAGDRAVAVLHAVGANLHGDQQLTEAMTRAFMFADASAREEIERVLRLVTDMVTAAVRTDGVAGPDDEAVAEVVADLWFAAMVAWVTGRRGAEETAARMESTVRLVVRE